MLKKMPALLLLLGLHLVRLVGKDSRAFISANIVGEPYLVINHRSMLSASRPRNLSKEVTLGVYTFESVDGVLDGCYSFIAMSLRMQLVKVG